VNSLKFWVGALVLVAAPLLLPPPAAWATIALVMFCLLFGLTQRLTVLHDRLFQLEERLRWNTYELPDKSLAGVDRHQRRTLDYHGAWLDRKPS
jgi:hypothetical protein